MTMLHSATKKLAHRRGSTRINGKQENRHLGQGVHRLGWNPTQAEVGYQPPALRDALFSRISARHWALCSTAEHLLLQAPFC